ncbi:ferritin family protein [Clostridium sp. JN-1]|uniref:ferritin-like domain-containing protein n=1 Tax=Clostridium sp. JN-1 TaxID=2483110 RepID=UPI000F0B1969|nr:ferritin family protein [Clostridium sp. JN-1]
MKTLVCVICGMQINDKNYSLNKEAFLSSNTKENIKFCPFCGAPIEYLKEDGEELQYDRNKLDDNALKIIDHAVKLEIFNGDFYKKASKLAKDSKVRDMFNDLSKIEYMHARIHKAIGGFKEEPVLRDMDYSKYDTDEILLEMACKREKHAVEYYEKYSKEINDDIIKQVFKALSKVEKGHIELTEMGS